MMFLMDTNLAKLDSSAVELDVPESRIGQLITPLTGYSNYGRDVFAIDNGAYSGFNAVKFFRLLDREMPNRERCKFVAVPDVVGSARRTLELFRHFAPKLRGWPLALVCQNGQEDLDIPWCEIKAVFIGGSANASGYEWKTSEASQQIIRTAQALGKWVHVGRVNGPDRVRWAEEVGADSVDGSGIAQYSAMRKKINGDKKNGKLFVEVA